MIFTLFPRDNVPTGTRIPTTWDALCQVVCLDEPAPRDVPKKSLGLWSPATFKGDYRSRSTVEAVYALGFDVDAEPVPSAGELRAAMAGQACLIHSSSSATPSAPRWRLLLQLSRPVTGPEYDAVWSFARARLPFAVGTEAKDPSRGWYMPRVPAEGAFVGVVLPGAPLDVDAVLGAASTEARPTARAPAPRELAAPPTANRRLAMAAALGAAWPEKGRHEAQLALAGALRAEGFDEAEAVEFLCAVTRAAGDEDRAKREATVRATYGKPEGSALTGWTRLKAHVDPVVVDAARGAVGRDAASNERTNRRLAEAASVGMGDPETESPGPVIVLGTDLSRVVDETADVLGRAPNLYQRGGELIRIVRVADTEADAENVEGTPTIRSVPPSTLKTILTSAARWMREKEVKGEWKTVATTPNDDVVAAVSQRGEWSRVRPLTGIVEAPTMRPDGSILQTPGYDAATAYIFEPGGTRYPAVPEQPTRDDARRALYELADVFADFPFASDAARATPIAAVLTVVGRPAIEGNVPAFGIDAPTRGTGKTLAADAIGMMATGRRLSKITFPASAEELEKILAGYARRGASIFSWDNVTVPFGGGPLDKVLTCGDTIDLRILGRSEVPTFRWRAVQLFTGNGIELCGDTARRVLVCRLESPLEDPENRADFRHADLLRYIDDNRPRLVVSALSMLRAYVVAGRPAVGVRPWGSFEQWSALVASAVAWSGGADPQGARPADDATAEPEKADLASLLAAWPATANGLTARELLMHTDGDLHHVVNRIVPLDERGDRARKFGRLLLRWRGRVVGGRRMSSTADPHAKISRWRVEVV